VGYTKKKEEKGRKRRTDPLKGYKGVSKVNRWAGTVLELKEYLVIKLR